MPFLEPFILGDHLFVEQLGSKPTYVIHRTIHLSESRFSSFYAFKNVNPTASHPDALTRDLRRESVTLEFLESDAIPRMHGFGLVQGCGYMITEYIWGKNLLQVLRELASYQRMLSLDYALHIACEASRVLEDAHFRQGADFPEGVLHGGLGPRGIVLAYTGDLHVLGFGAPVQQVTRGTWKQFEFRNLSYLSPEQVNGDAISHRSDIFSLGCILYEMLTGMPPFLEKTPEKVIRRISRCSFSEPRAVNPAIPKEVQDVVMRALAPYPADRHPNAAALREDLERLLLRVSPDFSSDHVRKLLRGLFEREIIEEIKHFGKLSDGVPTQFRPLVKSIPRVMFEWICSGSSLREKWDTPDLRRYVTPSPASSPSSSSASQTGSSPRMQVPRSRMAKSAAREAFPTPPEPDPPKSPVRLEPEPEPPAPEPPPPPPPDLEPMCDLSTAIATFDRIDSMKNPLRKSDSFFEVEDSVLVETPHPVCIVPVRVAGEPGLAYGVGEADECEQKTNVLGSVTHASAVAPSEADPHAQSTKVAPPDQYPPPSEGLVDAQQERARWVGRQFGEYVAVGILGWGGMGTVYDGIQPTIGKEVAIKVLNPALCTDPVMVQRFLTEARAVNSIANPNIIDIFAFGTIDGEYHYFVMEKLHGISLAAYELKHPVVSFATAHEIMAQVFSAMEAAHAKGIVHRDLKPDNIYLEKRPLYDHYVKILDFGIAKFTQGAQRQAITKAGTPIGTPLYMSPEQCQGLEVSAPSDIYSLGVILYEMFTGKLPFLKKSYLEMMLAHIHEPPPPPSRWLPMDSELERIILWCLEKDPKRRPQSIRELSERLLPWLKRNA